MKIRMTIILMVFLSCSLSLFCENFDKCATEYSVDTVTVFNQQKGSSLQSGSAISIPVVVHIIYNNSSQNISDSQILSQINVLNEDFRKMVDTRGYNTSGVGADTEIEFRLADRDPNNNLTNGITRHYSTKTDFPNNSTTEQYLQNTSYWDSDKYLNMWVVPEIGSGAIGYVTKFPWESGHPRGVVMKSIYFGDEVGTTISPYNLGRTTTHEVGHYFGLYHTFQFGCVNNNCSTDGDRVCDTPPCTRNFDCPTTKNSCSTDSPDLVDMIENYMDYTDDLCMNIFTTGQSIRMNSYYQSYYTNLGSSSGLLSNDFVIFNEHIGNYEYNITTNIISKSNYPYSDFVLKNGSSAKLRARGEIQLQDGFHAESGSEMRAHIDNALPTFPKKIKENDGIEFDISDVNKFINIAPNPITSVSDIKLTIGHVGYISLKLYDNLGNKRFTYLDGVSMNRGTYNYTIDGNKLNSGMYVLVLKVDDQIITKKVMNIK